MHGRTPEPQHTRRELDRRQRVGVVALEGGGQAHLAALRRLGQAAVAVARPADLAGLAALILPGGKSPALAASMMAAGLWEPARAFGARGKPIWGTCAGMVLLARESGRSQPLLGLMDLRVRRNAFGRPLERFETMLPIPALGWPPFPAVFRAAPAIEAAGAEVEILATLPDGAIVAVRQGRLLATAFHPEQTDDLRLHRYFLALTAGAGDEASTM
jgi:5'-phosphate synthase pdxT subunit